MLRPVCLRCERAENPLGIETQRPRLSWLFAGAERRGARQTAYRIQVASSLERLDAKPDLWDSGKVRGDQNVQVEYAGRRLRSGQEAWWRVRVWDEEGRAGEFSEPARWEMGLLSPEDWLGRWIRFQTGEDPSQPMPSPLLRKPFMVPAGGVVRARLYITAKGLYVCSINGLRVGADRLRPGWTEYSKRIPYQVYDVTKHLRDGENVVGIVLGDGWYCGHVSWHPRGLYGKMPEALAQLRIDMRDRSSKWICTDSSWRARSGPIQSNDLLMGEVYDARNEVPGWDEPGFDDSGWSKVQTRGLDKTSLVAQCAPPVRCTELLKPEAITKRGDSFIVDFGQNMVGVVQLRLRALCRDETEAAGGLKSKRRSIVLPRGRRVTLRHGEMLNADGLLYTQNLRGAKATDVYICAGRENETYEPEFTFHGFRYVEVTGYPGELKQEDVTGLVLGSDLERVGKLQTSNRLVNQLQSNIVWSQRGNYLEVPTDCPQRDERLGWTGDAQVFAPTACYNFDCERFLTKWLQDVRDSQSADGAFCDVAPRAGHTFEGAPAWADAGVIVPWVLYRFYADTRVLEESFDSMRAWVDYVAEANPSYLWLNRRGNDYGDWLNVNDETPKEVMATAYFAYSAYIVGSAAKVLGKKAEASKYFGLSRRIKDAFVRAFVMADGSISADTQASYVLALAFNIVPVHLRPVLGEHLKRKIVSANWHLSTGFLGTSQLLQTLADIGMADIAYKLLLNKTYPSWGYTIKNGATTIWERWDGFTPDRGFQDPAMNSFNHYAFGAVGEWLFSGVAGIAPAPDSAGFKRILLRPLPGSGLTHVKASYDSIVGRIVSNWKIKGDLFAWQVEIPANTSAVAHIPCSNTARLKESGRKIKSAPGVRFVAANSSRAIVELESGAYDFESELARDGEK